MNIETYFEEQKGITVDAARNAGAKYTAIDICRFAKNYHEREVENLDIQRVSNRRELLKTFLKHLDMNTGTRLNQDYDLLIDGFEGF